MHFSIPDLQLSAKKALPQMFYDYIDSGSWSEQMYRSNEIDLRSISLKQRVGVNVDSVDTGISTPLVSRIKIQSVFLQPVSLV